MPLRHGASLFRLPKAGRLHDAKVPPPNRSGMGIKIVNRNFLKRRTPCAKTFSALLVSDPCLKAVRPCARQARRTSVQLVPAVPGKTNHQRQEPLTIRLIPQRTGLFSSSKVAKRFIYTAPVRTDPLIPHDEEVPGGAVCGPPGVRIARYLRSCN